MCQGRGSGALRVQGWTPGAPCPLGQPRRPMGWGSSWLIWHTQEDVFSGLLAPARVPIGVVLARNLPITLLSFPRPTLHRFPSGEHHGQHLPGCAVHLPGRGVPREPHLSVVLGGGERLLQEVSLGRRLPLIPCRGCPRSLLLLLRRSPPLTSPPLVSRSDLKLRVRILIDGTLIIFRVKPEDAGKYTCIPSNSLGRSPSASAYLTVQCECGQRGRILVDELLEGVGDTRL